MRILCLALLCTTLAAQNRPPATPLITHDPYFSLWSTTDHLTDSPTKHWTGHVQPLTSLIRIDGKPYRIMGSDPRNVPALPQTAMQLTPTHTRYTFAGAGLEVELSFFTPAFLDDLDLLSRPVTYITWTAHSTDSATHDVAVLLDASPSLATSYDGQPVTAARHKIASGEVLSVGTRDQAILNRSGDDLRIDWGFFHLVVPTANVPTGNVPSGNATTTIASNTLRTFAQQGNASTDDDLEAANPHLAAILPLGTVTSTPISTHVLVSYTETYAIQLLQQNLRPYWQRDKLPVATMLNTAAADYARLEARGTKFDTDLTADLTKTAGEHYAWLCTLAYRQAIAAHKLVADAEGHPMLFAKENFSNGDIATVDVLYPSAPLFLFFNPKLLEAQVLPVLEYAAMPNRWHFPFAPHDLGQYPLANGQSYGGGEKTEEDQMPVEESGNLLILVDAIARAEHTPELAQRFWPQLTQWAEYLRKYGLDPDTQLTTDDFAGHVAHNANLSIKAIDALEAYADLAKLLHHEAIARDYDKTAKDYAAKWIAMAKEGDHYKLAFNSPNTWSQKYNLVWDKLLDYNLFPKEVRETEIKFYQTKLNVYGLPLDSRADYTKLDWELWTATLADSTAPFNALVDPIFRWTNETPTRVPLTDWYDTKTGKQVGFQARSVVGGLFIKALADRPLTEKWRAK
jgi:hypothetical protein